MKRILLSFFTLAAFGLSAQTFSDDFENYKAGDFVAKTNPSWTTWTNTPGSTEDTKVSSEKAKSGILSAKFSSTSASGGPTDLILPFFGDLSTVKNAGTFESTMWFYIPSGKSGYFNYQAKAPVGGIWAMDFYFDADGTYRLICSGAGGLQATNTYKQDEWFKYSCNIDLTTSTWVVSLNDKEIARFGTSNNSLFAMDIFPPDASSLFYVDNVSTTFTPHVPKQTDAAMLSIGLKKRALSGKTYPATAQIRNVGIDPITDLEYSWTDGVSTYTEKLTGLNVAQYAFLTLSPKDAYTAGAKTNKITFTILKVNGKADNDLKNDSKSLDVNVVVPAPDKKVVAEETTGTWCQWCPRGHVFMNNMSKEYPNHFVGIAVHGGSSTEPMKMPEYVDVVAGSGFPDVYVNRNEHMDPSGIEDAFFQRLVEPAEVKIAPKVSYSPASKTVIVDVTNTFTSDVKAGNYKIVAVVLEDSIKGTTSAYNQSNAYAGGGSGVMGGYEKLANPVPFSKMFYNHTARAVLSAIEGDDLATNPKAGDAVTKKFTYTIPATSKEKYTEVAVFVLDDSGAVVNGDQVKYEKFTILTGSNDVAEHPYFSNLAPNPAMDKTVVSLNIKETSNVAIQVVDLNGKSMSNTKYGALQGANNLTVDTSTLPAGIYLVRISMGNDTVTKRLVKE